VIIKLIMRINFFILAARVFFIFFNNKR
jgi:hypothetical protein